MNKLYRLIKDLPTFKAGCIFEYNHGLWWIEDEFGRRIVRDVPVCAYAEQTLKKFPNILKDWFEEIPEKPESLREISGQFIPKINNSEVHYPAYSYLDGGFISDHCTNVEYSEFSKAYARMGLSFATKKECDAWIAWQKAKAFLERGTKGFKAKKEDIYFQVAYDHCSRALVVRRHDGIYEGIKFATEEDAQNSVRRHPEEWKTYLGVEE